MEKENRFWKKFYNVSKKTFLDWRWQRDNLIRRVDQIPFANKEEIAKVCEKYKMCITPYYFSLIDIKNPNDPIKKQAIPSLEELIEEGYEDPLAEEKQKVVEGLVRRYEDRVLFIITNFCYTYCRHCTRKRIMSLNSKIDSLSNLEKVVRYIKKNKKIKEVIVSGGDPLTLPYPILEKTLSSLCEIENLETIRIGSRVPVVMPMKFYDKNLLKILKKYSRKKTIWLATHFNHPNEITYFTKKAIENILEVGIPVINQTVLLKGINDEVATMEKLCRELINIRVKPYYLFHCDNTRGVSHFITPVEKGIKIIEKLQGKIPGYAMPNYVIDLPGGEGKVPLMPNYYKKKGKRIEVKYKGKIFYF